MLPLCDLLINIELEALNEFYLSNDSNKSLKFFINRESGSDSCGSLTLAESSSDLPSLDLPKVSPGSPKRGMKRESNVSLKPCVPSKVTKGDPSPTKDISNKASSNLGELKKQRTKYSLFKIVIFVNKTLKIVHFLCQLSSHRVIKSSAKNALNFKKKCRHMYLPVISFTLLMCES